MRWKQVLQTVIVVKYLVWLMIENMTINRRTSITWAKYLLYQSKVLEKKTDTLGKLINWNPAFNKTINNMTVKKILNILTMTKFTKNQRLTHKIIYASILIKVVLFFIFICMTQRHKKSSDCRLNKIKFFWSRYRRKFKNYYPVQLVFDVSLFFHYTLYKTKS